MSDDETRNQSKVADLTTGQPDLRDRAQTLSEERYAVDMSVLDKATPAEASQASQWNPAITDIVKRNQAEPPPRPRASIQKQRPNTHEPAGGGDTVDVELCDGSTLRCIGEIIPP